jgi:hypothetical protein
MLRRIALFGESERGQTGVAYYCDSLPQLMDSLGNPPEESKGLHCAIQALLYNFSLIYFPVHLEGFSNDDYLQGFELLNQTEVIRDIGAVCLPGVGNRMILNTVARVCEVHSSILITNQTDLYDYLTA